MPVSAFQKTLKDYKLAISQGDIANSFTTGFFGSNPDIDTASEETIWDFDGIHPTFVNPLVANATFYVSSSNNLDTQTIGIPVLVDNGAGLWEPELKLVSLVGQTKTAITGDFIRISALGPLTGGLTQPSVIAGVVNAGDVYIYEDDTVTLGVPDTDSKVHSMIPSGDGVCHNSFITTPSGYTLWTDTTRFLLGKNKDATFVNNARINSAGFPAWRLSFAPAYEVNSEFKFGFYFAFPEKTDFMMSAVTINNNTRCSAGADFYMIKNLT